MRQPDCDVLIAGAGPAGSACAIRLCQLGLRVAIVDEVKDTALKIGESVPGATGRLFKGLGIQGIDAFLSPDEYCPVAANTSAWGTDHWTVNDGIRNPEGGGWHVLRHCFDRSLRQRAIMSGAAFYGGKVRRVTMDDIDNIDTPTFTVAFKRQKPDLPDCLTAKWLVDATGRAAFVSRQLGSTPNVYSQQMAAIGWMQSPVEDVDTNTRIKSVKNGWWYTAKLPQGLRVISFCGLLEDIAGMVKAPSCFFEALGETDLLPFSVNPRQRIADIVSCHAGVSVLERPIQGNFLAIGDSALSFDPLSSQGIFFAFYSAIRGAETILNILKFPTSRFDYESGYKQRIHNVFDANQQSRQYYYAVEQRFSNHAYWRRMVQGVT